jgi:copper chaperone
MQTLKFKTNINCNNCIEKVKPVLDTKNEIKEWNVDISNPDKILTVTGDNIDYQNIENTLFEIGYRAIKII